ncbi:MAG: RHS repeat-associated core domain-containing protein, partial [Candidatus Sulfotelmatobacter sp.]
QGIFSKNRTIASGAMWAKWPGMHQVSGQWWSKTVLGIVIDANGNILSDPSGKQYTWDFENRLTQVVNPGVGTTTFRYDPFGRRIDKISPSFTSVFVYDDDNLLETVNASGNEVAGYTQGLGLDDLLAMERGSVVDYYDADALGSVTSLTASTGSVAQNYSYDSFGNLSSSTGTIRNYFQFAGREFDTETNLYYFRHRYYDPSIGRFVSEDPDDEGSPYDRLNLYLYVGNHPVDWVDPLGLYTLKKGGPHPPLPPSPEIDALLKCIEAKTGLHLLVTSTSEDIPEHPPGTPHRRGVAVDVRYTPGTANQILCAAKECGAGFGLDEAAHPSKKSTGKHVHVQIPPGKRGGHGDLPNGPCSRCGN